MQFLGNRKWGFYQILLLGLVLSLLLAVACGTAATSTPRSTNTPRPATVAPTATSVPVAAVNPGKVTFMVPAWGNGRFDYSFAAGGGNNYSRFMHAFPIVTNDKGQLLPGLATKWEISKDGLTWTFTIRDGAKFQDGSAITADDVWWSWMHYFGKDDSGAALDRTVQANSQAVARALDKIERVGNNQVAFTRKSPDAGLPGTLVSEVTGTWYNVLPKRPKVHDDAQEAAYEKSPVGAGPMKLTKYVVSDVMSFERFDDFYYQPKNGLPEDRRVKFKSADVRLVPEEATRVAAIRSGEADIAPVSLATKKQVEAGGGRVAFGPEGSYIKAWMLGCWKPQFPCSDKRVRQALDYAIDKTAIQKLYGSDVFQLKGWTIATPSSNPYTPEIDPWPYDPNKARQLLADAGYPGGKGFGKFIVNTWVSASMPLMPESAQLAADYWKRELGIDVEVKVGDETTIKKQVLTEELHGQFVWQDNETRPDPASYWGAIYGTPSQGNRLQESPDVFDLVKKTLAVIDPVERKAAFGSLAKRLRDESYELGIGYTNIPWSVGPRIQAWQPWPLAVYPSNLHGITLKP